MISTHCRMPTLQYSTIALQNNDGATATGYKVCLLSLMDVRVRGWIGTGGPCVNTKDAKNQCYLGRRFPLDLFCSFSMSSRHQVHRW